MPGNPFQSGLSLWYTVCGGMAEWTIAAVLKTAGCNNPGGSNPSPSVERQQSLFTFGSEEVGAGLAPAPTETKETPVNCSGLSYWYVHLKGKRSICCVLGAVLGRAV